ncbi:ral guanine nucleotide dissociation stimulator-like 3 [Arvicanthis niloticus]|uniref:ral guanine nucleotide dissociation stimulator-like 3 n=1 Tax=Arvicanthis niloticus TaxID=61156 RepID=UPI0014866E97|nr:ral guanine nucleotide dissociation stimulator-like [Arvicanthis niloticus]
MFSCVKTTGGSGLKKDNRKGHGGVWRHRFHSCLQHLWPFSRKGKKLSKGSQGQDHTEQSEKASPPQDLREPVHHSRESRISAQTVVKQVNYLVPSLQEGDPSFVPNFLSTYRRFLTPVTVLDLLFMRYAYFCPDSEEDEQVKNTLCSFLETWMDKNPEDFYESSDLFPLEYLRAYLSVHMPHSDLIARIDELLTQLHEEQAKELEAKDEEVLSSDPEFKYCKSIGKPASLEPEQTCAPELESTKATRNFCDTCVATARYVSSTLASTADSSCGTRVSSCL